MITKFKHFDDEEYDGMWFIDSDKIYLIDSIISIPEKHHEVIVKFEINKMNGDINTKNPSTIYVPILDNEYFLTSQQVYDNFPKQMEKAYKYILNYVDMPIHLINPRRFKLAEMIKTKLENEIEEINIIAHTKKYNI